jgi:beta-lactamase superfamily II metal-dependent hydrolase
MLRIHFLNVGHGDCTIVKHPSGHITVIDINNSQKFDKATFEEAVQENMHRGMTYNSAVAEADLEAERELTDPIEFLKTTYPGETPFRFILTHPDLDHMRGLKNLYEHVGFSNFWDTNNTKEAPSKFKGDADQEDWRFYQKLRAGQIASLEPRNYLRGTKKFAFGQGEDGDASKGDGIEILSPTADLVRQCNDAMKSNDLSYVLRVNYAGVSILLPGDAEKLAWDTMLERYGKDLKSDYLKASHHGRDSGYHLEAVKTIAPRMTFVSVGRKPDTDASHKYRQFSDRVISTRYHGNLELRVHDDGTVRRIVQWNADEPVV